jgi:transcriptional regulator with XRE-family HTH domain
MLKGKEKPRIGDCLKSLREAAGISQQELAMKSGLSMSVVAGTEQGRRTDPRLSTLLALANALGVSLDALAGKSDTERVAKRKAQ